MNGKFYPGAYLPEMADKPAIVMAEDSSMMSYAQIDRFANKLGRFFQWLGLEEGDHVAYCVENRLECPAIQWGAHYVGLYYTFISTRLTGSEATYIVQDCDAKVLIVSAETAPRIVDSVKKMAQPPRIYCLDRVDSLALLVDEIDKFDGAPLHETNEGSEMLYSSGTTGKPKGVKPSLSGLPLGATSIIGGLLRQGFGVDAESIYLSPAPYYHAAPLKWVQGMMANGATVIMMKKFDAEGALQAIEKHGVTHSQWVPTMFHRLLALPNGVKKRYDLGTQKVVVHAAAPCPAATKREMIEWWGPIIYEYYSCTEGVGITFVNSQDWLDRPGTVGRPLMGVPHVLDDNGGECGPGNAGLIYFSDGSEFSYHKDEKKTAEAHNKKGWATVGDVGYVDEDGFLYLTDRKNNMIISGGVNIYPQETEDLLATHPKVFDVAVIGVPDEDLGERVCAVVQVESGVKADELLCEELIEFCRAHLSSVKCPKIIEFKDSLPREPNGKLLKRLLKDQYSAS